jgi:hypothetical protein
MSLSNEAVAEFKEIYKNEFDKEMSDAEARESGERLVGLFKLLLEIDRRDRRRRFRLKKEPQGFHLEDGIYDCLICGNRIEKETSWFDKWGQKCLICQKAVDSGTIPGFICFQDKSWYSTWDLKSKFGVKSTATVGKLVREGKLKARLILNDNGSVHEYVFLKKENPNIIDPDRNTPARKSYNKHRDKVHRQWAKEQKEKMKTESMKRKLSKLVDFTTPPTI